MRVEGAGYVLVKIEAVESEIQDLTDFYFGFRGWCLPSFAERMTRREVLDG